MIGNLDIANRDRLKNPGTIRDAGLASDSRQAPTKWRSV